MRRKSNIEDTIGESPGYLSSQIITYLGNKRSILHYINDAVCKVKEKLGKEKLNMLDAFSGSGIVSRLFKSHASFLISNDIEDYSVVVNKCYLSNRSEVDMKELSDIVDDLNKKVDSVDLPIGFIEELYSPKDENNITLDDRVFYTKKNARRLDNYRRLIDTLPKKFHHLLLAPLLSEASIHVNTSGSFHSFYKNRHTGIGQFGGTKSHCLSRIMGEITLKVPVLSNFECEYLVTQEDANSLCKKISNLDLAYFDPPYNYIPYGSRYFMLNLLVSYNRPEQISKVSGVPNNWNHSDYIIKSKHVSVFKDIIHSIDSKFILVSYSNEGFTPVEQMKSILGEVGHVETIEIPYTVYKASRSICDRPIRVIEYLFLVMKK